jgi:hypothetical protein
VVALCCVTQALQSTGRPFKIQGEAVLANGILNSATIRFW